MTDLTPLPTVTRTHNNRSKHTTYQSRRTNMAQLSSARLRLAAAIPNTSVILNVMMRTMRQRLFPCEPDGSHAAPEEPPRHPKLKIREHETPSKTEPQSESRSIFPPSCMRASPAESTHHRHDRKQKAISCQLSTMIIADECLRRRIGAPAYKIQVRHTAQDEILLVDIAAKLCRRDGNFLRAIRPARPTP